MTTYAATRARAAQRIRAKGAPIVFTWHVQGEYDESTGQTTGGGPQSAVGWAVQLENDPERLQALSLKLEDSVSLMVAAEDLAVEPTLGLAFTWAGRGYAVKSVEPLAPDGVPITYDVIGSRG